MDRPTLLILGGSNCQRNAFIYAKRRGIKTVLFDYLDNPPAARLADTHIKCSTFDVWGCVEAARKLELNGVTTLGTDQPVYTAAIIARELGLPSLIDVDTAYKATNKAAMKKAFAEWGIPCAVSYVVDKQGLLELAEDGPVVIKPLDGQGQKGVFLAENRRQAAEWFDEAIRFSRLDRLMCERFYPSDEVTVNAWVSGGVCRILAVTDRMAGIVGRSVGVCRSHRFPSQFARGHEGRVEELTHAVASALGVTEGPLYVQMLIGGEGVLVNEAACRVGGAFEDVFIPRLTGFDILGHVLDGALGGGVAKELCGVKERFAWVQFVFSAGETVGRLPRVEDVLAMDCVRDAGFNMAQGDTVPVFENSGARVGYAVFTSRTKERLDGAVGAYMRRLGGGFC